MPLIRFPPLGGREGGLPFPTIDMRWEGKDLSTPDHLPWESVTGNPRNNGLGNTLSYKL